MGLNLPIVRETFTPAEDQSWLGSAHGTQSMDSITLEAGSFLATFPDGVVPSGVVVARLTGGADAGKYARYVDGGANGAGTAAGLLFTTTDLRGTTADTAIDTPASLYWHGEVREANLPTGHGLDAAARADLSHIRFVA